MRVFLTVLDAVGCGNAPDAAEYGDAGSNTLGHVIAAARPKLPNLAALGLSRIPDTGYPEPPRIAGAYGRAMERSAGKDTTSGHWEMAGVRVEQPFRYFRMAFRRSLWKSTSVRSGTGASGTNPPPGR